MTGTPIRILLVDDHELIRNGLGAVIDLEDDLSVVATAGSVAEALAAYAELQARRGRRRPPAPGRHRPRHRARDPQGRPTRSA